MGQQYDGPVESSRPRPRSYQVPPPTDNSQAPRRPRASSQVPSDARPPPSGPINDAVNSALITSGPSGNIDPDLVAQVTEQVLNSLKLVGSNGTSAPLSQVTSHSSIDPSQRTVVTPPSPERPDEQAFRPASPTSNAPRQMDGHAEEQRYNQRSPEKRTSPPSEAGQGRESLRPKAPPRDPTDDTTTLEKIWQPLFGADGNPTVRLGQFLQGLAIHIIEDFEPTHSIVISPQKMLKFYELMKVPDEIYPWSSIFGGKMSSSSLSHLFRDLKCQHHFIQTVVDDKPNIPALTPQGFETWMTALIRSHPDTEYTRFTKAVLNMPISNAQNIKERFPKELSRRLFPKQSNMEIQLDFEDAVLADSVIELTPYGLSQQTSASRHAQPSSSALPSNTAPPPMSAPAPQPSYLSGSPKIPPPPTQAPPRPVQAVPPPTQRAQSPIGREPQLYSSNSSETAVDDSVAPVSIERERKPYYAQPGGGKVFQNSDVRTANSDFAAHPRAYSNAATARPILDPADEYGVKPRLRTESMAGASAPPRRYRSPSSNRQQNPYARSDAEVPASAYGGNASNLRADYDAEGLTKTYSRGEPPRRYRNEDQPRDYLPPPPPHPPPQRNEYEDDIYRRPAGNPNQQYPPPPPRYA